MAELASFVLVLHFIYVLAVVIPVPLIPIGAKLGWKWVRSWKIRAIHLGMMGFVAAETAIGVACPLTELENALLAAAGKAGYQDSFIGYWVSQIMYWNAPRWAFIATYGLFFALIGFLWWKYPPQRRASRDRDPRQDGSSKSANS